MHTIHRLCRACIEQNLPQVSIVRGNNGFGFTLCSNCPVRVQAVDPGGPAHQSGLCQGDSVLQLNGHPVETWKCVDVAHAIRNSSQIVLVVWRGLPELRSGCETWLRPQVHSKKTGRKLLPCPAHIKNGCQRAKWSGMRSSLGSLGSLWNERKEDNEEEQNMADFRHQTTTLKGTHVTSSNGDNYIILSPVNPGEQLLQPVYHDGTIGRLYQTHPRKGQKLLQQLHPEPSSVSTLPPLPSSSSSSAPFSNYSNYQNCTIVQSHLPFSAYGTYVSQPKTLIFPIFVQPLDLCSIERNLLMSEEMILHQTDLLPVKVTVLIYTDLLLLTREDEGGRFNVLQSPVYLNTIQLREMSSEPLHVYIIQNTQTCCGRLFSLESFSTEQKVRVSLCLHENIQLQLVDTKNLRSYQHPDLPSDFGFFSQSDHLPNSSSPCDFPRPCTHTPYSPSPLPSTAPPLAFSYFSPYTSSSSTLPHLLLHAPHLFSPTQKSPVWKEREREEEEVGERQQGEGESGSETSESVRGRALLLSPTNFTMKKEIEEDKEELTFAHKPAVLRHSLSEGSLLQKPRFPRFHSDSTIHQLTCPLNFDLDCGSAPKPPSPHTLRRHLTREGGSMQHMLLLLNGNKDPESRHQQLRQKTNNLAVDVLSRLTFLQRHKNSSCFQSHSLEKALRNNRPSSDEVLSWAGGLNVLLTNKHGLAVFRQFLRSEFSEEILDFWLAVEKFKKTRPHSKMASRAKKIYAEFVCKSAARRVNVDSSVRVSTNQSLCSGVDPASFQLAQDEVFGQMETDSYPRFLRSPLYAQLANQEAA